MDIDGFEGDGFEGEAVLAFLAKLTGEEIGKLTNIAAGSFGQGSAEAAYYDYVFHLGKKGKRSKKAPIERYDSSKGPPFPWAKTVMINFCRSRCRSEKARREREKKGCAEMGIINGQSWKNKAQANWLRRRTDPNFPEAMRHLDSMYRIPVEKFIELTLSEQPNVHQTIASTPGLGISVNLSKQRVRRAFQRISACLKRYPITTRYKINFVVSMYYSKTSANSHNKQELVGLIVQRLKEIVSTDPDRLDCIKDFVRLNKDTWVPDINATLIHKILKLIEKRLETSDDDATS